MAVRFYDTAAKGATPRKKMFENRLLGINDSQFSGGPFQVGGVTTQI